MHHANESVRKGNIWLKMVEGLWVEMESYNTIVPAKNGVQQKHQPEGIFPHTCVSWTTQDQTPLRRVRMCQVPVDAQVLQVCGW